MKWTRLGLIWLVILGCDSKQGTELKSLERSPFRKMFATTGRPVGVKTIGTTAYVFGMLRREKNNIVTRQGFLDILDLTDPFAPRFLGSTTFSLPVTSLEVDGEAAYIILQDLDDSSDYSDFSDFRDSWIHTYLEVLDVRDPQKIVKLSDTKLDIAGDRSLDMAIGAGRLTIWADGKTYSPYNLWVNVFDIQDPAKPVIVGQLVRSSDSEISHGDLLCDSLILLDRSRLELLSLDQLELPHPMANIPLPTDTKGTPTKVETVKINGTFGYLIDDKGEFQILDFTNPVNPKLLGHFPLPAIGHLALINGSSALITHHNNQVTRLDISDPTHPKLSGIFQLIDKLNTFTYYEHFSLKSLSLIDTVALIPEESGLELLKVEEPAAPSFSMTVPKGDPFLFPMADNRLFSAGDRLVALWDVQDHSNVITPIASLDLSTDANLIAVNERFAVAADSNTNTLQIIRIEPEGLQLISKFSNIMFKEARNILLSNNWAIHVGPAVLHFLDLSVLEKPKRIPFTYGKRTDLKGVTKAGESTIIIIYSDELHFLDMSTPLSPTLLSTWSAPATGSQRLHIRDVQANQAYAFVESDKTNLVLDLSDPTHPTPVGTLDLPLLEWHIRVQGNTLYAHDDNQGLLVYDISDPTHPELIGLYNDYFSEKSLISLSATSALIDAGGRGMLNPVRWVRRPLGLGSITALNPIESANSRERFYRFTWQEHFPDRDEQIFCEVSGGQCVVEQIDQSTNEAIVRWMNAPSSKGTQLRVMVGNVQYFETARVIK